MMRLNSSFECLIIASAPRGFRENHWLGGRPVDATTSIWKPDILLKRRRRIADTENDDYDTADVVRRQLPPFETCVEHVFHWANELFGNNDV